MRLSGHQEDLLGGKRGWPCQIAMRMLTAVGRAQDADDLIPVESVHLGLSGMSMAEPGMRFLEALAERGGKFVVPTTLNVLSLDRRTAGTQPELRSLESVQLRIVEACEAMGGRPTYTCNPFQLGILPKRDKSVAWNESATAPYVNAVLGARTNREGATALASALTGYTANYGMHLPLQRLGSQLVMVETPVAGADAFSIFGGAVARAAGSRIPVIEGVERIPTMEELTAFAAAFAAVSPLPMMHMVGITPEAPTRSDALRAGTAFEPVSIDASALSAEQSRHTTAKDDALDVVAIGCPHASIAQVREIALAIGGRKVAHNVRVFVQVNRDCADQADAGGLTNQLTGAGVTLLSDSCVHVAYDQIAAGRTLATNSLKIAYLTASHDVNVHFGTLNQCVDAAVAGRWVGRRS